MKTFKKIVVTFALVVTVLLPQLVFAQASPTPTPKTPTPTVKPTATPKTTPTAAPVSTSDTCAELKKKFDNAGGSNVIADLPKYCTIGSLYTKIVNTALYAIGIVAVLAAIYGGYVYMTAGGNAEQTKKGRSILTWAIIGLIVVLAAATIVNILVRGLVENRFV